MSDLLRDAVSGSLEGLEEVSPVAGGETLGRYTLLYELASGGMATLYLGRVLGPAGFQKLVAIKRIHPHLAKEKSFVDMFLDEARIAAGIQHPNVAQIYELGQQGRNYFLVMEYIEGESFARFARAHMTNQARAGKPARMPIRESTAIVADAAAGLHAAHELCAPDGTLLGVVHRDVSPHNILLTYDGHVKLVDFGVAKARGRISTTTDKSLKGKLAYMSPEQVRGKEVDRRSDIFALGIVLYEMTCSRRLFKNESEVDTIRQILDGAIQPPHELIPGYPQALEQVVLKALSYDRGRRYRTAEEMHRELQQVLHELGPPVTAADIGHLMRSAFGDRIRLKQRLRESSASGTIPAADAAAIATDSGSLTFSSLASKLRRAGHALDRGRLRLVSALGGLGRLPAWALALLLAAVMAILTLALGYWALRAIATPEASGRYIPPDSSAGSLGDGPRLATTGQRPRSR
ncbi:MAG: serine/threonine protein kinase [Deltaproteobacteria bacterium]|nr:serine/threonine protein kinase [Deltaproteobacteria bacterium]